MPIQFSVEKIKRTVSVKIWACGNPGILPKLENFLVSEGLHSLPAFSEKFPENREIIMLLYHGLSGMANLSIGKGWETGKKDFLVVNTEF